MECTFDLLNWGSVFGIFLPGRGKPPLRKDSFVLEQRTSRENPKMNTVRFLKPYFLFYSERSIGSTFSFSSPPPTKSHSGRVKMFVTAYFFEILYPILNQEIQRLHLLLRILFLFPHHQRFSFLASMSDTISLYAL